MVVGLLQVEVHLPDSHSLKDKRSVLKSLKDQMRHRFNIAVAELDASEKWQRATIGISTVGDQHDHVEGLLDQVDDWIRETRLVSLIRVDKMSFSPE